MSNTAARSKKRITIGLDLGDRRHTFCVLDETGKVAREGTLGNTREELATIGAKLSRRDRGDGSRHAQPVGELLSAGAGSSSDRG